MSRPTELAGIGSSTRIRDGAQQIVGLRLADVRRYEDAFATKLGVDEIHRDDNFFDLGGHSLLAARAVAMIERDLGLRVAPRRLIFESLQQIANPDNAA